MSALWGTQTQRTRVLFVSAALVVSLTGCEYGGPAEGAAGSSSPGATAQPRSTGVTMAPNSDPRASSLKDMSDWSSQQLKPALPGQVAGSASSNSTIGYGMTARPGNYELHFLCEGPADVELSVASWAGAAVLEPVRVACDGGVFAAQVKLDTEGADFTMNPGSGPDRRYAFRLVPAS
ncbi:hypothetical protein NFC73_13345 [Pseudarthrobacter sp. RMG13]|uniref:Lipoprotein n=1 Tax=Pseudarthrobacter humi TaxID=2952523 RepID=A0ABT1LSD2_9MICC|nr:hypothetical protein [Pseudarthrobacter humi]MCP9000706.1 hypothetical protein [Pseudarthrobacter humi]